jgi:hypothetical protein
MNEKETYPKKVRMVFHMTYGDPIQSAEIIIADEKENVKWGTVLRDPKNAGHYAFPVVNAFGEEDTMFINPTYVMAVRIINIKDTF